MPDQNKHIFISYVHENIDKIQKLCKDLSVCGAKIWLDRNEIDPGIRWKLAIRQAIQNGAFFIACFSKESTQRYESYMNEELILAIERLRTISTDYSWFIPVKLNECDIPDLDIGAGGTLNSLHWVSLEENWAEGVRQILKVIDVQQHKDKQEDDMLMLPTMEEFKKLSKWEIVAFAAKCVRWIQPIFMEWFDEYGGDSSLYPHNDSMLDYAISWTERSAASYKIAETTADPMSEIGDAARYAADGAPIDSAPKFVGKAGDAAVKTVLSNGDETAEAAAQCIVFAVQAVEKYANSQLKDGKFLPPRFNPMTFSMKIRREFNLLNERIEKPSKDSISSVNISLEPSMKIKPPENLVDAIKKLFQRWIS